jgi:hypothetical protein
VLKIAVAILLSAANALSTTGAVNILFRVSARLPASPASDIDPTKIAVEAFTSEPLAASEMAPRLINSEKIMLSVSADSFTSLTVSSPVSEEKGVSEYDDIPNTFTPA